MPPTSSKRSRTSSAREPIASDPIRRSTADSRCMNPRGLSSPTGTRGRYCPPTLSLGWLSWIAHPRRMGNFACSLAKESKWRASAHVTSRRRTVSAATSHKRTSSHSTRRRCTPPAKVAHQTARLDNVTRLHAPDALNTTPQRWFLNRVPRFESWRRRLGHRNAVGRLAIAQHPHKQSRRTTSVRHRRQAAAQPTHAHRQWSPSHQVTPAGPGGASRLRR